MPNDQSLNLLKQGAQGRYDLKIWLMIVIAMYSIKTATLFFFFFFFFAAA